MIDAHFDEDDGECAEIPKLCATKGHCSVYKYIDLCIYCWDMYIDIVKVVLTIEIIHSQSSHHNFWRRIRLLMTLIATVAADSIVIAIITLVAHARIPFSDASPRAVMTAIMDVIFAFPFITKASSGMKKDSQRKARGRIAKPFTALDSPNTSKNRNI